MPAGENTQHRRYTDIILQNYMYPIVLSTSASHAQYEAYPSVYAQYLKVPTQG